MRVTAPTRCVRQDRWFQIFLIFTPKIGEDEPILTKYVSTGLVQPPTRNGLGCFSKVSRKLSSQTTRRSKS